MSQEQWTAVDRYITDLVVPADAVLDAALADSVAAGLPAISVSPNQGKFLHLLARIQGARSILEIGTLGGYSTIWLARAMPDPVTTRAFRGFDGSTRCSLPSLASAPPWSRLWEARDMTASRSRW